MGTQHVYLSKRRLLLSEDPCNNTEEINTEYRSSVNKIGGLHEHAQQQLKGIECHVGTQRVCM